MFTPPAQDLDFLVASMVRMYLSSEKRAPRTILGIPRGGMPVAYMLRAEFERQAPSSPNILVDAAPDATLLAGRSRGGGPMHTYGLPALVVDDIVDTGMTMAPYHRIVGGIDTAAIYMRDGASVLPDLLGALLTTTDFVRFPWDERSGAPDAAVVRILQYLGVDANSPSLKETPRRFLAWMNEFSEGQPEPDITTFEGIENFDEMVLVKDVHFTSLCEHHLLPFSGVAAVAYVPQDRIIGLSKLARIVLWRAKRLQVQERLTTEIADSVAKETGSPHVAVTISAEHSCMSMRGPMVPGHKTITSKLMGMFLEDASARQEFLSLSRPS